MDADRNKSQVGETAELRAAAEQPPASGFETMAAQMLNTNRLMMKQMEEIAKQAEKAASAAVEAAEAARKSDVHNSAQSSVRGEAGNKGAAGAQPQLASLTAENLRQHSRSCRNGSPGQHHEQQPQQEPEAQQNSECGR